MALYTTVEIISFAVAVYRALNETNNLNAFYFWFYLGRLTFLAGAIVLFFNRLDKRFYVATLSELSTEDYWSLVFICLASTKLLFSRFFIQLSSNLVIEYSILTFLLIHLLIRYQGQYWVFDKKKEREKRIFKLVRKAQLSKIEYEAALPFLIDNGYKNQRSPWLWKVVVFLALLILGAIFNAVAIQLVDSFGPIIKP
ncbi:MAG: hypothetical protein WA821_09390 [Anaerolineales bacterium]